MRAIGHRIRASPILSQNQVFRAFLFTLAGFAPLVIGASILARAAVFRIALQIGAVVAAHHFWSFACRIRLLAFAAYAALICFTGMSRFAAVIVICLRVDARPVNTGVFTARIAAQNLVIRATRRLFALAAAGAQCGRHSQRKNI